MKRHKSLFHGAAVLACVAGLMSASAAGAATVVVTVPKPAAKVVAVLPPTVVAYPLNRARATVVKEAPKGRVALKLAAGPWIIATATTPRFGAKRRYRARLVVVGSAPQTLTTKGAAAPAPAGIALGEITFQTGNVRFRIDDAFKDDAPRLAKLAPCRPPIAPLLRKDPLWQTIRNAAVQAGKSGPRASRAAARAAAASLNAAAPAAVFGGSITVTGATAVGSFTISDSSGQTVWSGTFQTPQGRNAVPSLYGQAFTQALKAFCAPSRIQVDATITFDSNDTQGSEVYRGTGVLAAKVVGRERVNADGTVARGDFEYETAVLWDGRDPGATVLVGRCTAQPTFVWEGFGLLQQPLGPPTALAVYRPDNTFLVFLPPAAVVKFNKVAPAADCTGQGAIRAFFRPNGVGLHQVVVPKLGQPTELTASGTVVTTTTNWTTRVTVTRLPSLPPQ